MVYTACNVNQKSKVGSPEWTDGVAPAPSPRPVPSRPGGGAWPAPGRAAEHREQRHCAGAAAASPPPPPHALFYTRIFAATASAQSGARASAVPRLPQACAYLSRAHGAGRRCLPALPRADPRLGPRAAAGKRKRARAPVCPRAQFGVLNPRPAAQRCWRGAGPSFLFNDRHQT